MGTCRCCLGNADMSIFYDDRLTILNKLLGASKIKVCKNDGYHEYICLQCILKLEAAVAFLNICEESDRILRSKMNLEPASISEEFIYELKQFSVDDDYGNEEKKVIITKQECSDNDDDRCSVSFDDFLDFNEENQSSEVKKKKRKNLEDNNLLCFQCGEQFEFYQKKPFERHVLSHGERKFKCDECPKAFYTEHSVKDHRLTHSSSKVPCQYCNKLFKNNRQVKTHTLHMHKRPKTYQCNFCDKVYHSPGTFRSHVHTHTAKKKFKCEFCEKAYTQKFSLAAHTRIHTNERPYMCKYCDKKFTISQNLREHERLHTGVTPYKCPVCLKGFAQKGNMKSHFKFNHKNLDFKKTLLAYRQNQSNLNQPTKETSTNSSETNCD